MLFRARSLSVLLLAVASLLLAQPEGAVAGTLVGVYVPAEPGSPRFFAAIFEGESETDREDTALACAEFASQNQLSTSGEWLSCPFLVGSQKLMVGCVGTDGRLQFYVTACCREDYVCTCAYRPGAEAAPENIPPGHGREYQLGWENITIGNFYNSLNIQFRCRSFKAE
jgi:hypothetical protein